MFVPLEEGPFLYMNNSGTKHFLPVVGTAQPFEGAICSSITKTKIFSSRTRLSALSGA